MFYILWDLSSTFFLRQNLNKVNRINNINNKSMQLCNDLFVGKNMYVYLSLLS